MLVCNTCNRSEEEVKITKKTMLCKKCYDKEHHKKNYENNKEIIKQRKKIHYENNKEILKEKVRFILKIIKKR